MCMLLLIFVSLRQCFMGSYERFVWAHHVLSLVCNSDCAFTASKSHNNLVNAFFQMTTAQCDFSLILR